MSSRIASICEKLLEAGWLAALIVAPLFFDVYSSRVFEPDKISLVRSIALMMAGAWLVKRIDAGLPQTSLRDWARGIVQSNPLILPTLGIVVVYLISTIFSVVPNVSLWGSYQRLQGTYTTFSYIVIFLCAASTLRTRAQLERVIHTIILTSFPIAFYGIVQHFKLDPLPWGGDTTERVAANMGNSIFVAAYLIMIVPLALVRWLEVLVRVTGNSARQFVLIGVAFLVLVSLGVLWVVDFALGTGFAIALLLAALFIGIARQARLRDLLSLAAYTIILPAQLVAIFFTQSRGPWLGLGAGLFAFLILGALMLMHRLSRAGRTLVFSGIFGAAVVVILFLVVFNLPASPLESLKSVPYIGRLGQILDPNSPTARVRELIWQGALQLVLPHAPLWSPTTGADPLNAIRPLVGYGPESMYVAYNPFYPPDLGHYEARNASPDRSHNETFDALVTTGLFGFIASIVLFMSVFYYGLKWLGLITTKRERNTFIALWLVTGFAFAIFFGAWRGWHWIGVALPAGMIVGFLIFLVLDALRRYRTEGDVPDVRRALWLTALIAALIGHFVELHFGIAIVSTRTYFWFYAALLVVIGTHQIVESERRPAPAPAPASMPENPRASAQRRRQRRRIAENTHAVASDKDLSPAPVVAWTVITIIVLVTMAFEFITNQIGTPSPLEAVRTSLFVKGDANSYGIFGLFVLTAVIAGILGLTDPRVKRTTWLYDVLLFAILTFTALVWFVMLQTRWITTPGELTDAFINLLSFYFAVLFIAIAALALALWFEGAARPHLLARTSLALVAGALSIVLITTAIYLTNYGGIKADILYKAGGNFDANGAWDRSIDAYSKALALQPTQDFYALFLGRAYLESARTTTDAKRRTDLLNQSERTLLLARQLNPLNTDHSANLARMHRIVAQLVDSPADKAAHNQKSADYYADALRLSPNTSYLYNEAYLTYAQMGDWARAKAELDQSLALDSQYAQTYVYLGEYYRAQHDLAKAADNYLQALKMDVTSLNDPSGNLQDGPASVFSAPENFQRVIDTYKSIAATNPQSTQPHQALADLYRRRGQMDLARQELEQIIRITPQDFMAHLTLVNFLSEQGQIDAAVAEMAKVMELVPRTRSDYARFQDFYTQLQNLQKTVQTAQKSPNDVNAHRTLAALWKARGQPQFALPEYQAVARLAPNDYDAQKNIVLLSLQVERLDEATSALPQALALAPANDKPMWQNIQAAMNAHKTGQFDQAVQAAQAALAQAGDIDKASLQAYVALLQEKQGSKP